MAVFFKNNCKFKGCAKIYPTLSGLIEHIEIAHIDFNPQVIAESEEQHPVSIPLSYALKYSQRTVKDPTTTDVRLRLLQHATKLALGKQKDGHGQIEDDTVSESESSNDSWLPTKETTILENEFISFKYANQSYLKRNRNNLNNKEKPYACSIPGCKKRYKNINGIKYHYKNGHSLAETGKRSHKHVYGKIHKEHNSRRICHDEVVAIHMPNTAMDYSTSPNAFYSSTDYTEVTCPDATTTITNTFNQVEDMDNQISTSLNIINNNDLSYISHCSKMDNPEWSNTGMRNDLTTIKSETLSKNYVSHFHHN